MMGKSIEIDIFIIIYLEFNLKHIYNKLLSGVILCTDLTQSYQKQSN